ncbi:MAG: Tripartite ATP-independent periplasmic transporter [Syntrophaceae bacterium PtaU1.Bin231]|nr:MAG: Tripartite ATP-independent periplasmic transporter [Syntrophaceae bacterium PtaU1.Bin231]
MDQFVKKWNQIELFLVGVLTLTALTGVVYATFGRYVLRSPSDWPEEVIVYMIIGAVFLAASSLVDRNGHVAATLVVERFPMNVRRVLAVFNAVVALVFCAVVLWYGINIVMLNYNANQLSNTSLRFPLWIPYLSIPTGCFLMTMRYLIRLWRLLFRFQMSDILEHHEMSREGARS